MNTKRIVIWEGLGALRVARAAYAKVLQALGWEVYVYGGQEAILDFLKKVEPVSVFLGSWEIDRATLKGLQQRPHLDIILWCPNYGDMDQEILDSDHEVLMASPESIKYVDQLKQTNKLNHCFQYYHQRWMNVTHNKWKNHGLEPIGIPLAACLYDYSVGTYNEALACDLGFVGGFWKFKGINLKKYIYPLALLEDFNLKVFGYGDWSISQFIGGIATENIRHLFASSKVCGAVYEPLIELRHDVSERPFKILSAGGFCVSQWIDSATNDIFTNNEMVFVDSPEEFVDATLHYKNHPEERLPFILRGLEYAYTSGNYFSRMKDLASAMGWFDEVIKLNSILQNVGSQIPQIKQAAIHNHERVCNAI